MIESSGKRIKIFGFNSTRSLAEQVCRDLGLMLSPLKEEIFPDGELKIHSSEDVLNADVFVFHSLGGNSDRSVNDRLCELYFLLCTLRDRGARQITALIPYLPYARSDQRKESADPVLNRYVAQMLEGSGVNRVVSMDIHNISAFENAYHCPVENLEASSLFCQFITSGISERDPPVVLSPDIGGIKRVENLRKKLESVSELSVSSAFLEKFRTAESLTGSKLVGEIQGRQIFIVDDMISTGETILRAVEACEKEGGGRITVFATHGIFTRNQEQLLNSKMIDQIVVTDSHPALRDLPPYPKLKILSCAPVFSSFVSSVIQSM